MTTYIISKKPSQIQEIKNNFPDNYSEPIVEWGQINSRKIKNIQKGDIVIGLQIDDELKLELEKNGAEWIKHSVQLAPTESNEKKTEETTDCKQFQIDIFFSIVSDQPIPNIIPVIDEKIRPKKIVLLHTENFLQKAKYLSQTIKNIEDSVEVELEQIQNNEFGTSYNQAYDEISRVYDKYYKNEITIGLNATGGTKMTSFAGLCVFEKNNSPIFYIDKDKLYILPVQPNQEKDISITINKDIGIKNFLSSYGKRLDDIKNNTENELTKDVYAKLKKFRITNISKNNLLKDINNDTSGYKVDVTVMFDNELYFIICKTKLSKDMNTDEIYKSFAKIKQINALKVNLIIFSKNNPSNPNDKNRADNLGIKFIIGEKNIKKYLKNPIELFKR